ncbi:hypothetical protein LshimejAT787_0100120 [Lyophyllum shimeji]|uniref:Uncharacterized protein n=1 Tax=Lyophyllum shimeji TaxID=47721 RepID=A0A9P3PCD2_LYOSH|nr:hypothetical protein LshimejAT787_0100120 [Lyophyllum shimeji]
MPITLKEASRASASDTAPLVRGHLITEAPDVHLGAYTRHRRTSPTVCTQILYHLLMASIVAMLATWRDHTKALRVPARGQVDPYPAVIRHPPKFASNAATRRGERRHTIDYSRIYPPRLLMFGSWELSHIGNIASRRA